MSNNKTQSTMNNKIKLINPYLIVLETNMGDGIDLKHYWSNVDEARESGRFDYLVENGDIASKRFYSIKKISTLVKLASPNFYILD
jgi:hypothetical protein